MLAIVYASALVGIEAKVVEVQVDFNPRAGIPSFTIVGLPDTAVKESRERVRSAIKNSNYATQQWRKNSSPQVGGNAVSTLTSQRAQGNEERYSGLQFPNKAYVVNLSPADLPKHGPAYDLAIAVGVLAATDQIPLPMLQKSQFIGELSLDGRIRHVNGVLPMAYTASNEGFETIYVSEEDAPQAALVKNINVIPIETLGHLVEHLYGLNTIVPYVLSDIDLSTASLPDEVTDFADVRGQEHVKRALEIAAAGNHNVRLVGPPGVGKSLLAHAMPGILPPMTIQEALEVTRIYSVADMLNGDSPLVRHRPFQSPHHTISQAGLVGGGTIPKPGAVSLSHRGVLFLDDVEKSYITAYPHPVRV